MKKLLLVSHGQMATGMKLAVEMIIGKMQVIDAICLTEEKSSEQFTVEVLTLLQNNQYEDADAIIVLADLRGGSPHTNTLRALQSADLLDKTIVITGMNLALAIGIAMTDEFTNLEEIQLAIDEARDNLSIFTIDDGDDDEL